MCVKKEKKKKDIGNYAIHFNQRDFQQKENDHTTENYEIAPNIKIVTYQIMFLISYVQV